MSEAYGTGTLALIGLITIILVAFFAFLIAIGVRGFRMRRYLFGLSVDISADSIEITNRKGKYFLPTADIKHVFPYRGMGIMLVWSDDGNITFLLEDGLFRSKDFKAMSKRLTMFPKYIDDKKAIKQICRNLKLHNYFRKNRFEYRLGKLAATPA
ncbi:MAG: hypothetical protein ACYTE5_04945 [Planctomycetota bacterium]